MSRENDKSVRALPRGQRISVEHHVELLRFASELLDQMPPRVFHLATKIASAIDDAMLGNRLEEHYAAEVDPQAVADQVREAVLAICVKRLQIEQRAMRKARHARN